MWTNSTAELGQMLGKVEKFLWKLASQVMVQVSMQIKSFVSACQD